MFRPNSRYARVPLFAEDPDGRSDFRGVMPREIPPTQGEVEHVVRRQDRPDRLAQEYYATTGAWWRIMDANPDYVIAGPIRTEDGALHSGGDGVVRRKAPETLLPGPAAEAAANPAETGDVMLSDQTEGAAVLIPRREG